MAIKIEDLRNAAKRTPTNEDAGYYTQDPVNEASAPPHPVNWDKGFQHPYRVAAGGTERPYLKDGRWKLRLFNVKDRKNYIYDYGTDLMDLDESVDVAPTMSVKMACDLIVAKVNELIPKADDINNRINVIRDAARNNLFSWAKALTGEDIVKQLNDIHTQRFKVEEKKKYINLDIGGSGKFMVSKVAGAPMEHSVPGDIYGIKGYGVIHTGHRYGNIYQISAIDFLKAANVVSLTAKAIDMAARGEKGPDVSHINPVATHPQPEPQHVTVARKNNIIPFPKRF